MQYRIKEIAIDMTPADRSHVARQLLADLINDVFHLRRMPEMRILPTGKPVFADAEGLHFSLSHCTKAVMAVVDNRPVGCDVEDIVDDVSDELLLFAFDEREQKLINNPKKFRLSERDSFNSREVLTAIWTRKEAEVKREGVIPDNPSGWPSDGTNIITRIKSDRGYAFSIATSGNLQAHRPLSKSII